MKKLIMGSISLIIAMMLLEAFARLTGTIYHDVTNIDSNSKFYEREWSACSPSPYLGWEKKRGYKGTHVDGISREFDNDGFFSIDSKQLSDSKRKVIFIGDSNTAGWGIPDSETFVEVVESLVPDINAINLSVWGYTSYQGRVCLEKNMPLLKPSAVVVSFNFNDRRYVLSKGEMDGPEQFGRIYKYSSSTTQNLTQILDVCYLFKAVRWSMRRMKLIPSVPKKLEEIQVDILSPRVDEEGYRRNLTWIAKETKRLGIPLIFVILGDNPLQTENLRKGIKALEDTKFEVAIGHLMVDVQSQSVFSDLARIYLSKALQGKGEVEKGKKILHSRSIIKTLHGGRPVRLDSAYNNIMRQVGQAYSVAVVEASKVLEDYPFDYMDNCHFNSAGHRKIGELLAKRLKQVLSNPKLSKISQRQTHPVGP